MYDTILNNITYTVIDLETTGYNPVRGDKIVEIGAVKCTLDSGIIAEFSQLINPERDIPYYASRIHNITEDKVADKPVIEDILPEILEFLKSTVIIMHNAPFDVKFISYEMNNVLNINYDFITLDTLKLTRHLLPGISHKLSFLSEYFGYTTEYHRALNDVKSTWHVFKNMVNNYFKPSEDNISILSRYFYQLKK